MNEGALLEVRDLKKHFPVRGGVFSRKVGVVRAVDGVSFDLRKGETLGLVGESGCGKSTLGRTILRLEEPTAGEVRYEGRDILSADRHELFTLRRNLQMIFQDPYSSLNPRMTIGEIVREPLDIHREGTDSDRTRKVASLLSAVGLKPDMVTRYPHEFSGGQRQRIGIARTLALNPKIIIADEPVSALDVSVRAQVINLMVQLQRELGLTYVFISHDLSVVEYLTDRIAIMYLGRIIEMGARETIFARPAHPYTRALIAAVPIPDPRARKEPELIKGEIPSPLNPPSGCSFHPRCPFAIAACKEVEPPLEAVDGHATHVAACIRKHEI
jgi:oligopeptide/dipeptide ABC transporter ATP-binding protein